MTFTYKYSRWPILDYLSPSCHVIDISYIKCPRSNEKALDIDGVCTMSPVIIVYQLAQRQRKKHRKVDEWTKVFHT